MADAVRDKSSTILPPLPYGFTPRDNGDIYRGRWLEKGEHPVTNRRPRGNTPARRAGYRYQKKVTDSLRLFHLDGEWHVDQWIQYIYGDGKPGSGDWRTAVCQPDAVLVCPIDSHGLHRLVVFEIKYTLTTDAWWQLRHRYRPVLSAMYPLHRIVSVVVVRHYAPELHRLFPDAAAWELSMSMASLPMRDTIIVARSP